MPCHPNDTLTSCCANTIMPYSGLFKCTLMSLSRMKTYVQQPNARMEMLSRVKWVPAPQESKLERRFRVAFSCTVSWKRANKFVLRHATTTWGKTGPYNYNFLWACRTRFKGLHVAPFVEGTYINTG